MNTASPRVQRPSRWMIPLLLVLLIAASVRLEIVRVFAADGSLLDESRRFSFLSWKETPPIDAQAQTIETTRFAVFGLWWSKVMNAPVWDPNPAR